MRSTAVPLSLGALSSTTHHRGYELAPTAGELREWQAGVDSVAALLERRSGAEREERGALQSMLP